MGVDVYNALAVNQLTCSNLLGKSGSPVSIGSASTGHSLTDVYDLIIEGKLEVDGFAYFDAGLYVPTGAFLYFGGSSIQYGGFTMSTDDGLLFLAGETTNLGNHNIIITSSANRAKDHDHDTLSTDPHLFIHSATDPDTANTQWVSIWHDQTDGNIDCGTGTLNLGATGNVNFAGATFTGGGDTVSNGYVTIEVAGAAKKFMITA